MLGDTFASSPVCMRWNKCPRYPDIPPLTAITIIRLQLPSQDGRSMQRAGRQQKVAVDYSQTEYIHRVDSRVSATILTARGTEAGVLGWGIDGRVFEEEDGGKEGADIGACGE